MCVSVHLLLTDETYRVAVVIIACNYGNLLSVSAQTYLIVES